MAKGYFPILPGMSPAPRVNFAAMAAGAPPGGPNQFAYLAYGEQNGVMQWFRWVDTNNNPVGPMGDDSFSWSPHVWYSFGRPGSPQQGWVLTTQGWYQGWPYMDGFGYPVSNFGGPLKESITQQQGYQQARQIAEAQQQAAGGTSGALQQPLPMGNMGAGPMVGGSMHTSYSLAATIVAMQATKAAKDSLEATIGDIEGQTATAVTGASFEATRDYVVDKCKAIKTMVEQFKTAALVESLATGNNSAALVVALTA